MASVLQVKNDGGSGTTGTTTALTFTSNVTGGSTIVLMLGYVENGTRCTGVADNLGNVYKRTGYYIANARGVEQWAAFNVTGGACTVTATWSGSKTADLSLAELALNSTAYANPGIGRATDTTGTSHSAANVTNANANGVFVMAGQTGGPGVDTQGTGYTMQRSNVDRLTWETKVVSATETNNGPYTTAGSLGTTNLLVVYEEGPAPAVATQFKVGSFQAPTATGFQAVTGVGFHPKAVLLWGGGMAAAPPEKADFDYFGYGFSDGPDVNGGHSMALSGQMNDNSGVANGGRGMSTTRVVRMTNNAATDEFVADLVSFDGDGFSLNWSTVQAFSPYFHYLVIGGDDVSAKVQNFADNTSTGNQAVTGVGFKPSALWLTPTRDTAQGAALSDFGMAFGFTDGVNQGASASQSQRVTAPTSTTRYQRTSKVLGAHLTNSNTIAGEATIVSFDSDGFTINWSTAPATAVLTGYLALKGVLANVGTFLQPTSTGAQAITGTGFKPGALLVSSVNQTGQTTVQRNSRLTIGASDGTTQGAQWHGDADAVNPSQGARYNTLSELAVALTPAATGTASTLNASATLTSFDTNGFTLNWGTADATQREWIYLAVAAGAASGGAGGGGGGGVSAMAAARIQLRQLGAAVYGSQ